MYGPLYASHMYFIRMVSLISFFYKHVRLSSNIANRAVFIDCRKGLVLVLVLVLLRPLVG